MYQLHKAKTIPANGYIDFHITLPHIPINLPQNSQDPPTRGLIEQPQHPLIVLIRKRCFEEHARLDSPVPGKVADDVVDEGHLVGAERGGAQKIGEGFPGGGFVEAK